MAKGYFMVTEDIKDQDGMNAYSGKALPTILQSGGKLLIVERNAGASRTDRFCKVPHQRHPSSSAASRCRAPRGRGVGPLPPTDTPALAPPPAWRRLT